MKVAAGAASAHRLDDVLELAAESALEAIGAASLSIGRWEEGEVVTLINVGELTPHEERFPPDERYSLSDFPTTLRVLRDGGWMICEVDDPSADPAHRELLRTVEKETSLTVPIVFEGETWGEFWAGSRIGGPRFVAGDSVFMRAVADQIAAAIGRAELFAQVEALAYTDPLTGLANRRMLEEELERACDESTEAGSPALFLCDIDGLKEINDGHGHDAGDQVIRRVADALSAAAAPHLRAVVSRMGGDEFCVLLPDGDADMALTVFQDASRRLHAADGDRVAVSCGIAAAGPGLNRPAALLREADFAQYRAKRAGRETTQAFAQELLDMIAMHNGAGTADLLVELRHRLEREARS